MSLRYNRARHLDNGRLDGAIAPIVHSLHPERAITNLGRISYQCLSLVLDP
jgi:hypothetical protein